MIIFNEVIRPICLRRAVSLHYSNRILTSLLWEVAFLVPWLGLVQVFFVALLASVSAYQHDVAPEGVLPHLYDAVSPAPHILSSEESSHDDASAPLPGKRKTNSKQSLQWSFNKATIRDASGSFLQSLKFFLKEKGSPPPPPRPKNYKKHNSTFLIKHKEKDNSDHPRPPLAKKAGIVWF